MRETAWEKRIPTQTHELRYTRLLMLHDLTLTWLEAAKKEAPPESPDSRISTSDLAWMIDILSGIARKTHHDENKWGLRQFMDDTSVDDVVARLEAGVWITQGHTFKHVRDAYPAEERRAVIDNMGQSSWRSGRAHAEIVWKSFPQELRHDVRGIFRAALDSPFLGSSEPGGLLIERQLKTSVTARFPKCAHQSRFPELQAIADDLCTLHTQWLRGFAYALQPRLRIESRLDRGVCLHHWKLGEIASGS